LITVDDLFPKNVDRFIFYIQNKELFDEILEECEIDAKATEIISNYLC